MIETHVIEYEYIIEAESEAEALEEVGYMHDSEAISESTIDITRVLKGELNE